MDDLFSRSALWTAWLILHGLLAVGLIGALTHQACACLSRSARSASSGFVERFKTVPAQRYARAVAVLWVFCFVIGGIIYSEYRISVRMPMEQQGYFKTLGSFELKEHLSALGLGMLPAYLWAWQSTHSAAQSVRKPLTLLLALLAWYTFLAGHVVNNVRGFAA
jgi:hypothetical protein